MLLGNLVSFLFQVFRNLFVLETSVANSGLLVNRQDQGYWNS